MTALNAVFVGPLGFSGHFLFNSCVAPRCKNGLFSAVPSLPKGFKENSFLQHFVLFNKLSQALKKVTRHNDVVTLYTEQNVTIT